MSVNSTASCRFLRSDLARVDPHKPVRKALMLLALACFTASATAAETADPSSDAPETQRPHTATFKHAASWPQALKLWQTPEDVSAWIGARFEYDMQRAMRLSETQRSQSGTLPITEPAAFFSDPAGVCVDLSRFAVETLRAITPDLKPRYLMIEFAPAVIAGNTLRLHWVATFTREGQHYFFADSKRPGHIAGPYASAQSFIDEYAKYRGREIVAFREPASYLKQQRTMAVKQSRESAEPAR